MSEKGAVLVTGGAGYIGSHACKALAEGGWRPVAFDNLVYGHEEAVRWGPLERGELEDRARLDEVMERYRPVAVMHFAAYAYVGESVENPGKYYRNNVAGSLTLLEACRDRGIDRFIFSSTCATYGMPEVVPITESEPQKPINPYGASKLMIERMLRDFDHAHGLRSVSLRYFNAAGADESGEIGEDHDPETHLIPLVIDAALGRRSHIEVYGDDYPTPDGSAIRDYIHVTDLAAAHVLALDYLGEGGETTALNLGTGNGHSVLEIIRAVERVSGRKVPMKIGPRRPGDPPELVADASLARRVLGWSPRYVSVDEVVRSAWRWHTRAGTG